MIVLWQAENGNLEKADILELTVTQLRRMVANTEMQCVYGYSACVQEVNEFLLGVRYDEATRRRIVQHLCRRRPSLVPTAGRRTASLTAWRRVPSDAESTSGDNASAAASREHVRMFSYSSADSTTDVAAELGEAGTTAAAAVVSGNTGSASISQVVGESIASDVSAVCLVHTEDNSLHGVGSTDDAVPAMMGVHTTDTDAAESDSHVLDDVVLSPVWRPW